MLLMKAESRLSCWQRDNRLKALHDAVDSMKDALENGKE